MANKEWYKSKSLHGAALILVAALAEALGYPSLRNVLLSVGGSLGIIGLRLAKDKLV